MNERITGKLINMEVLKILKNSMFQGGVALACLAAFLIGREGYYSPESFGVKHVLSFYGLIANFVIYYFSARMLGEDFDIKTSTMIFSGRKSRAEIYAAKIVSFLAVGVLLGILSAIVSVVGNMVLNDTMSVSLLFGEFGKYILFYVSYSLSVGATALLAATLFQKTVTVLCIVAIGYSVVPEMIGMALTRLPFLQGSAKFIPFYGGWMCLNTTEIEPQCIAGMVLFGLLFFLVSIKIAERQDFK